MPPQKDHASWSDQDLIKIAQSQESIFCVADYIIHTNLSVPPTRNKEETLPSIVTLLFRL